MVGIMDLNDEKDNIDDLERDEEILLEQLGNIKRKAEWIAEMMDELSGTASQLKMKIDRIHERKIEIMKKKQNEKPKVL